MSKLYLTHTLILISSFNIISSYLKFNIPSDRDKCYGQDFYVEGTLLIKYDLSGFEKEYRGVNEQNNLFKNIKVFIKNELNKNIYETELKSRKEKFAIRIKEAGHYSICARYNKPTRRGRDLSNNIMMALKLRTDYEHKDLGEKLMREDVDKFWKKIREIKRDIRPSIEAAQIELTEEDKTAKSIFSSINIYYKLCCIQLTIIFVLTIYNLVSYKDFFKEKSIIWEWEYIYIFFYLYYLYMLWDLQIKHKNNYI